MKRKILLLFLTVVTILPLARGQDEQFKALFMYNFTKYLQWPTNKEQGDFVITVLGNSPIVNELKTIAQKKKVGTQNIVVLKANSIAECSNCNILYIPNNKQVPVDDIQNQLAGKGILVITDAPGMAKSVSGINYVKQDGKQSFEINKVHIESQGIKVNTQLISLGIRVQ